MKEILLSKPCLERGIFNVGVLQEACLDPGATLFWPLVNIELWFRLFIDQDPFWVNKVEETRRKSLCQRMITARSADAF